MSGEAKKGSGRDWRGVVEDRIQEAMEAGAFDDLPGKGKPLDLDDNPFEARGSWAAHHLLRTNGYTLPWIEERREIEAEIEAMRAALGRSYAWARGGLAMEPPDARAESEWERAVGDFRERAAKINRRIRDHNLKVPDVAFQHPLLSVEREIANLTRASLRD